MIQIPENTEYINKIPFPYLIQDNCLEREFAKKCQEEILNIPQEDWDRYNNPFEQKWTLRDKDKLPPTIQQLFDYLTSQEWLNNLSNIVKTQLYNDPTKNWWGIHTYDDGDYLDIHSDAGVHPVTHQKKHCTLGIYLSTDWKEENGGYLEIWQGSDINQEERRLDKCIKKILPIFNRFILFDNTNNAWHGNPEPVKCKNGERRIFLTISYLSNKHDGEYSNRRKKALFIKHPDEPKDKVKERLRLIRADAEKFKEVYSIK